MPRKTKQYGWQCSECDKGDPSVQISNLAPPQAIDLEAPKASRNRGQPIRLNSIILSMCINSLIDKFRKIIYLQVTQTPKVLETVLMIWSQ